MSVSDAPGVFLVVGGLPLQNPIFNLCNYGFDVVAQARALARLWLHTHPWLGAHICLQIPCYAYGVHGQEGVPRRKGGPLGRQLHHSDLCLMYMI